MSGEERPVCILSELSIHILRVIVVHDGLLLSFSNSAAKVLKTNDMPKCLIEKVATSALGYEQKKSLPHVLR